MNTRTIASCVVLFSLESTICHAQQVLFRDDFDGTVSAELSVANHEGDRSVVDGWYQWTPTANTTMNSISDGYPDDISLRTRARLLGRPTGDWVFVGFGGRSDTIPNNGVSDYFGGITTDGRLGVGISGEVILAEVPTALDVVTQDIDMQFDLVGNNLQFTAWEAGTTQPAPQISVMDDSLPTGGRVYLSYNPRSTDLQTVAFDFFEVVAIPEPSSVALLAMLGMTLMPLRCRHSPATDVQF